jgi:hypothetical protein
MKVVGGVEGAPILRQLVAGSGCPTMTREVVSRSVRILTMMSGYHWLAVAT